MYQNNNRGNDLIASTCDSISQYRYIARAIDEDDVVVMEELTNEAEAVMAILYLASATDIVQIFCTSFTLLHIKLCNF